MGFGGRRRIILKALAIEQFERMMFMVHGLDPNK
jgi:hypothetical protein